MSRRVNPRSLENLNRAGRSPAYGEPKRTHEVSVTETGWQGVRELAASMSLSVSELLERLGRERCLPVLVGGGLNKDDD